MLPILALTVVGGVVGWLLARSYPKPARQQIFAAVAATVASVLIMGRPGGDDTAWYHVSFAIGVSMGTFLILVFFRHLDRPSSAGPA
jgi:uncharacterized membrane protein YfcA